MVYPVNVYDFQGQAAHRLHKQHIQMGLRKGMAVLVYYRVEGGPHVNAIFQAVLIAHESAATRGKKNDNKLWKRVVPSETEFAWLPPDIAWAFCSDALRRRSDCQYLAFHQAHMGLHGRAFQANIFIADMVFLGDTRSAEELAVFTNMAPERLCLGCGLRVDEKFTPIFPGERGPLLAASVKLLQFALRASSASASSKELTEDEVALLQAIRPLLTNPDCHFLAVLTALVQSILEGRTDCPISGVFGAGKTRAAAAMIAGLLVMDPTLKVMVVTKENAAAHAFAKHIESLQLPQSLEEKFGRLVGATELEKGPASQSKLDILPGSRNTVLRTKQVIIGCGGGFHQECTQPYSPVARWMSEVDIAFNDEGQQYGNLDEASAIARVPRKGLVIWCGDHKQTPGGLRKSDEARAFRRKLMRRPIALRGDTKFLPPHMLGAIVHPYVQDVPGPQGAGLGQLLQESTRQPLGLTAESVAVFQELCKETIGNCWEAGITPCCCAAIAVLWLALAPERFPLQADTFSRAAGTAGKQKWSLILPSSARVSELTYVTIIGTRYPELDQVNNDIIQFGNYLQAEQCTRGGFLPIFWDAPFSYINASTDIGEVVDWITDKFVVANKGDLAVLHNRNKMVNAFANTEWVSGSGGAVISRSVTSCAGMTAYLVLLAQTRVGFLSGGRGKSFHQLPPQEQAAQREEAYARATVALTRAQQICFLMGPLDMRGLVGAATIIGCLKYGASFCGQDDQDDPVFLIRIKDEDLLEAPDDAAFLQSLRHSCARVSGVYPPLALVEAYITEEDSAPRVRRLHLIIVDLHRRRRMAHRVLKLLTDLQIDRCAGECLNTFPIPWKPNQEAYQLRYVFGYAMEGSDLPCYIVWPTRTAEQSFWCIDAWKGDWVRLDKCGYMAPMGIEHFFDAFCLDPQRPWRTAACHALGIPSCHVSEDTHLETIHANKFSLTPRRIPVERMTAIKQDVDQEMVAREESKRWSGVSDNSSTDSECTDVEASSVASDLDRFDTAYDAFRDLAHGLYHIDLRRYSRGVTSEDAAGVLLVDGYEKLQELVHLPRTWPLGRLTIPLEGLIKQIDRLLEGYCFQILATNLHPEAHNEKVLQTATHLTWILTEYLADTIAWLMRSILGHDSKILCDKDTQQLLTPKFWVLPLYRELLNSARRIRPSPSSERARGCTGLVKVICKENKEQKGKRKYHAGTPHPNDRGGFTQWFGSCSLITTLYVWFPACWAPMVAERLFSWSPPPKGSSYSQRGRSDSGPPHKYSGEHPWHRDSQGAAGSSGAREAMEESDSTEVQYKIRQWSLPGAAIVPVLNVTSRVSWLELDDKALLGSYGVLQEGILCDVFSQKCSAAWQGARAERLTVGIMLPGPQEADDWLNFMLSQKNLWPTFTTRGTLNEEISAQAFSKERKRLQAFHLWMDVKLRWGVLLDRMYVTAPTGKSEAELDALLFDKVARRHRTDPYEEKKYRGAGIEEVRAWWKSCRNWMESYRTYGEPFVFDFKKLLKALSAKDTAAQLEVDNFMENCAKRWQTKDGTYRLKRRRLPDVRDSPGYPGADIDMGDI